MNINQPHRLLMFDDISRSKDEISPRKEEGMYNPVIHLDLDHKKKHNSVVPIRKETEEKKLGNSSDYNLSKAEYPKNALRNRSLGKSKLDDHSELKKMDSKIKKILTGRQKFVLAIIDSNYVLTVMTMMTLFALFSNDIQYAWCPSSVDSTFDIVQTVLMFSFTVEIVLTAYAKDDYLWSFFFWLDVISTISLIQDITFIFDNLLSVGSVDVIIYNNNNSTDTNRDKASNGQATNAVQRVSSASRATRVLRIIRIIRLIRIVKLYKNAIMARAKVEKRRIIQSKKTSLNSSMVDVSIFNENNNKNIEENTNKELKILKPRKSVSKLSNIKFNF
jgi:hypothetical protein